MTLRSFRAQLLLSSALVGTALIGAIPSGAVVAQEVIDGGEMLTVPGDRPDPWIIPGDGTLTIGLSSVGGLTIQNAGSVIASGNTLMGFEAGSTGSLTVDGTGSRLETGNLIVGTNGSGVLTIQNGAVVHADDLSAIGTLSGSQGTAIVTGAGSSSLFDAQFWVGRSGTGTLTIADGGRVVSEAGGRVGQFPGSSGAVTVTGNGSRWESRDFLTIGNAKGGDGTLTVQEGGVVTTGTAILGVEPQPTSPGINGLVATVLVTGMGSRFEVEDGLYIGDGVAGTSILSVKDGGFVSAGDVIIGTLAGGTGILNIGAGPGEAASAPGAFETPTIAFSDGAGTLNFNHTGTAHEFAAAVSGSGDINHMAGTTVLTGDSSGFAGLTDVTGGDFRINATLGGQAQIGTSAALSGIGTLAETVTVADGGQVSPGDNGTGTLSVGSLALSSGAHLNFDLGTPDVVGGLSNDLINVVGDLMLDGTLNVANAGGFGSGVYRLINYGGSLNDNGLGLGAIPGGVSPADLLVQTSVANQVNLISVSDAQLSFWDGASPALYGNGAVDGGSGMWRADGRAWTRSDGAINGSFRPIPSFAIFQGAAGVVSVNDSAGAIFVTGLQFATDRYVVTGESIALAGPDAIIRVGDGTAAGVSMAAIIASALTGSSALIKTDLGTLVLAGDNSFSGGTTIQDGTVRLGASQRLADGGPVNVADGATFDLAGFDETIGALSGAGRVLLGAGGLTAGDGSDSLFSGTISGTGGVTKRGTGSLVLTHNNNFTGGLNVKNGALFNHGVLSSRAVVNAALFGGVGSSSGLEANAGSTIAPGDGGIGTMTVAGDAAFNKGSTFAVDIAPDGTGDRLAVTGTTVISPTGTTLGVTGAPGDYPLTNTYTVLTSDGGIDGQFAGVQDNLPDIDLEAVYQPNAVQLRYFQTSRLTSPKQIHPSAQAAALDATRLFSQTMRRRSGLYTGTNEETRSFTSDAALAAGEAGQTHPLTGPALHTIAVWSAAMGEISKNSASGQTPGWDARSGGVAFGLEHRFDAFDGVMGLAGAMTNTNVDSGASDADVNAWYAGAYGTADVGGLVLSGALSYSWQTYKFDRRVPVAGGTSRASGKADGTALTVSGEAFYDVAGLAGFGGLRAGPLVTLETILSKRDGFSETGAGILNLTVSDETAHKTVSGLGIAVGADHAFGNMRLSADVRLAWEHVFGDRSVVVNSAIPIAGATFVTSSASSDRDRLAVGLGGALHVSKRVSAHIRYDGSFAGSTADHSGAAGLTFRF